MRYTLNKSKWERESDAVTLEAKAATTPAGTTYYLQPPFNRREDYPGEGGYKEMSSILADK